MNEKSFRVMVVDDDESIRNSLHKLLGGEGYQVLLAANGREALEMFQREQQQVDLLLVDLNMPMKNGWVTLNQLLEMKPLLPVIILTGLPHQRELAEAAGVSALVEKPVDVTALLRLINQQIFEPLRSPVQQPVPREFPFRYLRAANYALHRWANQDDASYAHWGLNE